MSASDHLSGKQFEQLPLLMTPHEVGQLRSGDFNFAHMHEVPHLMRGQYAHQAEKKAARGMPESESHLDRVQASIAKRGIEEPVRVVHSQRLPGVKSLYDGHHRAVTAMEQNRLLPVTHYDDHTQVMKDIMNSPTWVQDHS